MIWESPIDSVQNNHALVAACRRRSIVHDGAIVRCPRSSSTGGSSLELIEGKVQTAVHRVRKFVEIGSGRIGYAMTAAVERQQWDKMGAGPSFSVADAILDDPDSGSVLSAVLKDGHVIIAAP